MHTIMAQFRVVYGKLNLLDSHCRSGLPDVSRNLFQYIYVTCFESDTSSPDREEQTSDAHVH